MGLLDEMQDLVDGVIDFATDVKRIFVMLGTVLLMVPVGLLFLGVVLSPKDSKGNAQRAADAMQAAVEHELPWYADINGAVLLGALAVVIAAGWWIIRNVDFEG